MGILSKITKALGLSKELNVEEFMTASEAEEVDVLHKAADFYGTQRNKVCAAFHSLHGS